MELFLDTANIDEIRQGARLGVLTGITTNPSLVAKEGIGKPEDYKSAVEEIARIIDGPISVEVVSSDVEGMITEGRDIAGWIPNPWVKLPSIPAGFEAMAVLTKDGINVNQTLCFSVNQALMGAHAGATVVSSFVGRAGRRGQRWYGSSGGYRHRLQALRHKNQGSGRQHTPPHALRGRGQGGRRHLHHTF